ncbi:MAG: class I SAM-dependent methyltransferase [Candidatus Binatales bacterium]
MASDSIDNRRPSDRRADHNDDQSADHQSADHKAVVREEFTRQAEAYAAAAPIKDPDRLRRLVEAVNPRPDARVLEVATGPGHVAMAFAAACREVVGLDLTAAPVAIANRASRERELKNVRFEVGDAEHLPFTDGEFDVTVCRFAVHHFENPARVIAEMTRVCGVGGSVAIEDLIASEHPERAEYHNRFERLRDTSHTRALPLSELVKTMAAAGLEIVRFHSDRIVNPVELWIANAQTAPDRAEQTRAMLEEDLRRDLSGTHPFRNDRDGQLYFTHRIATVIGRKLARG